VCASELYHRVDAQVAEKSREHWSSLVAPSFEVHLERSWSFGQYTGSLPWGIGQNTREKEANGRQQRLVYVAGKDKNGQKRYYNIEKESGRFRIFLYFSN
jgi:hypothetical protein